MYTLVDSHCHLDFDVFDEDRNEVITRAKTNGISDIIIPGVSRNNWSKIQLICRNNKHIHPCYGLHPYLVAQHTNNDIDHLKQWINQNHCVAIGECGLDYRSGQADRKTQMSFFELQLEVALDLHLPVVIHSVLATEDIIKIIHKNPGLHGMVHSYSGSYEQAMVLIEAGFYISLGGTLTYEHAKKVRNVASNIPLSSILLETDAPDQPDQEHNGQRNEPSYLVNVLECLSQLRDENKEEIAEQTSINARKLFNI